MTITVQRQSTIKMQSHNTHWILIFIAAATAFAAPQSPVVSEKQSPGYDYLPPNIESTEPEVTTTVAPFVTTTEIAAETTNPPTNEPSPNGYEYRVVRRLKYRYRTQRDVSHLFGTKPQQHYLPPKNEYLQPQTVEDDSVVIDAPALKISHDYLPPIDNEITHTEAQTTTEVAQTSAQPETEVESTDAPQDTVVLATDGYHYKQPKVAFELEPESHDGAEEYLPPLEEDHVEVDGPGDESTVLADDGYHYRVIRRLKF